LPERTGTAGYVSVYLSDPLARYPVRAVTKPRDNKSDPNLETGTYGVFSTCQVKMRKSIATKGVEYIFFVTTHRPKQRVVTGYYQVGWYAPGPDGDHVLAAARWRFVAPIATSSLPGDLRGFAEVRRGYSQLDPAQALRMRAVLDRHPDLTDRYVAEVKRLETLNHRHTGYRYPSWRRTAGWSWADVATYLGHPARAGTPAANSAPGGRWVCSACGGSSINQARLKRCPACGAISTLSPSAKE
jgi:hypothetical protein